MNKPTEEDVEKIILVDFDGTVVRHMYPMIGELLDGAVETLKDLEKAGYTLVLWTCRSGEHFDHAMNFCKEHGINMITAEESRKMIEEVYGEESLPEGRKPYARWHIDDRNLGGFPGWDKVREILLETA